MELQMNHQKHKFNPLNVDIFLPNWKSLLQKLDTVYYHCKLPLLGNVPVTLSDVINVQQRPILESEAWSLLSGCAEALEDFLISAIQFPDIVIEINLDTILLNSSGKIYFKETENVTRKSNSKIEDIQVNKEHLSKKSFEKFEGNQILEEIDSSCGATNDETVGSSTRRQSITWAVTVPRRYSLQTNNYTNYDYVSGELLPKDPLEMKHIFSLGQSLRAGTMAYIHRSNEKQSKIGTLLNAVMTAMMEPNIDFRMRLSDVIRICSVHVAKYTNGEPAVEIIKKLHKKIMDEIPEEEILTEVYKRIKLESSYQKLVVEINKYTPKDFCDCNHSRIEDEYVGMTYGKRLDYHPKRKLSLSTNICNKCRTDFDVKVNLKEVWYWAFLSVLANKKLDEISKSYSSDILINHPAKNTIAAIYNQLLERRIVLNGLRTGIGQTSANKDMSFKQNGSKKLIQSLPSLVLLLQEKPSILPGSKVLEKNTSYNNSIDSKSSRYSYCEKEIINIVIDKYNKNSKDIKVKLPDSTVFIFHCNPSTTLSKTLLKHICLNLDIQEQYYFHLSYLKDNEFYFLPRMSRISAAPLSKYPRECSYYYFRIKYFLKDTFQLRNNITKHLFATQLYKDVTNFDSIYPSEVTRKLRDILPEDVKLPSIIEFKNFKEDSSKIEDYKNSKKMFNEILNTLFDFEIYGLHSYKFDQSKKMNSTVLLAVGIDSVLVFEPSSSGFTKTQEYMWGDIKNISYKQYQFELIPRVCNKSGASVTYNFFTKDRVKSRYFFRLISDCHKFSLDGMDKSNQEFYC